MTRLRVIQYVNRIPLLTQKVTQCKVSCYLIFLFFLLLPSSACYFSACPLSVSLVFVISFKRSKFAAWNRNAGLKVSSSLFCPKSFINSVLRKTLLTSQAPTPLLCPRLPIPWRKPSPSLSTADTLSLGKVCEKTCAKTNLTCKADYLVGTAVSSFDPLLMNLK